MTRPNLWWGYLHINGSIQAKRWHGPAELTEASGSELVESIVGPFSAPTREAALKQVKEKLQK